MIGGATVNNTVHRRAPMPVILVNRDFLLLVTSSVMRSPPTSSSWICIRLMGSWRGLGWLASSAMTWKRGVWWRSDVPSSPISTTQRGTLYEHHRINSSWMVWKLVKEIKHDGLATMMELLTVFIKEGDIFGYNSRWELSKEAPQPSCELVGQEKLEEGSVNVW